MPSTLTSPPPSTRSTRAAVTSSASDIPGVSAILDYLSQQAAGIVGSSSGLNIATLQTGGQGLCKYYWQSPRDLSFNYKSYNWIAAPLTAGANPPVLANDFFTNVYLKAISKVTYSLSKADQAKLSKAYLDSQKQQTALLTAWKAAYGSLPSGNSPIDAILTIVAQTWAAPATTVIAIRNSTNLSKLLNNAPVSGASLLPLLASFLAALGDSVSLQNQVTMNNAYLADVVDAVQNPSIANGGLQTDNPDGKIVPAYAINTPLADLLNGLANTGSAVTASMEVARTDQSDYQVSFAGHASFEIPLGWFLSVSVDADASYFEEQIATSSNSVSVAMTFPGVTAMQYGPVAFNAASIQGWYYMDPIREAIKNGNTDVSGYHFAVNPNIDFTASGPFGFANAVAISSYPTISITVKSSNYQSIATTFQESSSVGVSFLGISFGGSQSTYSATAEANSSNQTTTITLTPPATVVAGTPEDSGAWVLGGQTLFPAA